MPWLLLVGTVVFALVFVREHGCAGYVQIGPRTLLCCQFFLGIYCGYFGGAVGIMTLATWSLLGMTDIKAMNATKTLLVGATNAVAVVCFIVAGKVWWPQTCVMLLAAIVGGYSGARLARRLPPHRLRMGITVFNVVITAVFFLRGPVVATAWRSLSVSPMRVSEFVGWAPPTGVPWPVAGGRCPLYQTIDAAPPADSSSATSRGHGMTAPVPFASCDDATAPFGKALACGNRHHTRGSRARGRQHVLAEPDELRRGVRREIPGVVLGVGIFDQRELDASLGGQPGE